MLTQAVGLTPKLSLLLYHNPIRCHNIFLYAVFLMLAPCCHFDSTVAIFGAASVLHPNCMFILLYVSLQD
jgi:hypothetical protein